MAGSTSDDNWDTTMTVESINYLRERVGTIDESSFHSSVSTIKNTSNFASGYDSSVITESHDAVRNDVVEPL